MDKTSDLICFEGISSAHFGEFLQGRLPSNESFLVSCPINIHCKCHIFKHVFLEQQNLDEKKKLFLSLFENMTHTKIKNKIMFESPIPQSIGMGSSTADLVALFRALNQMTGNLYSIDHCGQIASKIEPSDGTLYNGLLVFNQLSAKPIYFINNIIQDFMIIGIIEDRLVDTLTYNRSIQFSMDEKRQYASILPDFIYACERGDLELFGAMSTLSLEMNLKRNDHFFFDHLKSLVTKKIVLGLVGSHSGSCSGVFISMQDEELTDKIVFIKKYLKRRGLSPLLFKTSFGVTSPGKSSPDSIRI